MTTPSDEQLRKLAEEARDTYAQNMKCQSGEENWGPLEKFEGTCNPTMALSLLDRLTALEAELARVKGVLAKLPQTKDGVPITPGMKVWRVVERNGMQELSPDVLCNNENYCFDPSECYSTREAALAAKESK